LGKTVDFLPARGRFLCSFSQELKELEKYAGIVKILLENTKTKYIIMKGMLMFGQ